MQIGAYAPVGRRLESTQIDLISCAAPADPNVPIGPSPSEQIDRSVRLVTRATARIGRDSLMLGRRWKPTVSSVEESWSVSQGTYDDRPLLARFNAGYTKATDRSDYVIQIGVAIPVNLPDERGWPSGDENQQLQSVETEVARAAGDRAVLVGVLTVNGVRELVLYARDADWIEQFHHQLQESIATHEVQVMARRDPEWAVFDQFVTSP